MIIITLKIYSITEALKRILKLGTWYMRSEWCNRPYISIAGFLML